MQTACSEVKDQRRETWNERTQGEEKLASDRPHSKLAASAEGSHWRSQRIAVCPVASPRTQAGRLLKQETTSKKTEEATVELVGKGEVLEVIFKETGKDGYCRSSKQGNQRVCEVLSLSI